MALSTGKKIGIGISLALLLLIVGPIIWLANQPDPTEILARTLPAGTPTNLYQLNNWYPAVGDDENAALAYTQAGYKLVAYVPPQKRAAKSIPVAGFFHGRRLNPETSPDATELEALQKHVADNSEALDWIARGSARLKSRFPISFLGGPNMMIPHPSFLLGLARLMTAKVIVDAETGEKSSAVEDIVHIIRLARSTEEEPLLLSTQVSITQTEYALDGWNYLLDRHAPSASELDAVRKALENIDWKRRYGRSLLAEMLLMSGPNLLLGGSMGPVTGFKRGLLDLFCTTTSDSRWAAKKQSEWLGYFLGKKPLVYSEIRQFGARFEQELKSRPFWSVMPKITLASSIHPYIADNWARAESNLELFRASIAVERFRMATGRFPDSLSELTPRFLPAIPRDAYNGKPLIYRNGGSGYKIYAVGPNLSDDGGDDNKFRDRVFEVKRDAKKGI